MNANKEQIEFSGKPQRLDAFVADHMPGYSREIIKAMIKNSQVAVNGETITKPSFLLEIDSLIDICWQKADKNDAARLKAMIIYEDRHILVVNKPSGLLVHPLSPTWEQAPQAVFSGEETLVKLLLSAYPKLEDTGIDRLGLVHRLDRETSGTMVIAKTPQAQKKLIAQFHDRLTHKIYNCIACGMMKEDKGIIDVPIGRISGDKRIKASSIGREAVTEYSVMERKNGYTLLSLTPKTGRTNQLRVHMSWLGYPVLGDSVYKGEPAARLMLHSRELGFIHPSSGKPVKLEAPLPKDFLDAWKAIAKHVKTGKTT